MPQTKRTLFKRTARKPVETPASAAPANPDDLARQLWIAYKAAPTDTLRNQLIEHYLPLVQRCAQRLQKKLPSVVQLDELISAGNLGLMDAIESFQVDRHVQFSTFSALRIRGAILDELRAVDWAPRTARNGAKRLEAASQQLRTEMGRLPSDEEVADRLGMSPLEYRRTARDCRSIAITSLSRGRESTGTETDTNDAVSLADDRALDPVNESQRRALRAYVTQGLSRAERLLVTLYYYENLTMREVGQVLDLSESRVSQMHTQIVRRLQGALQTNQPAVSELAAAA